MADTAASTVVTALKEALLASPGVSEITVDGIKVVVDYKQLDWWERRAAREESPSTRPIAASVNLSQPD